MTEDGRQASLAHPLCRCVVSVPSLVSLVGAFRPDWPGIKYVNTVTESSRAACPMHRPEDAEQ